MSIIDRIKKAKVSLQAGDLPYIPHPPELGGFTKVFPGRLKGDVTCVTGSTGSAKTSLTKYLIFKAIEWAIKNNKNYHVIWFGLEESKEQFEFTLLSWLLYKESRGKTRYNIEHFEGLGKTVNDADLPYIELMEDTFDKFMSYVSFHDLTLNSFGIYKEVRDFARSRGTFYYKNTPLTLEDLQAQRKWDRYQATDEKEYIEVVVDHISLLTVQKDEKDTREAMTNLLKHLRIHAAKMFKYSVVIVQQQALEMENLDHIKEKYVYASVQGLGNNKELSRDYLNIIGITNINKVGIKIAEVENGSINVSGLQDFQRVIGILKRRYGKANKKYLTYFDGCVGWFHEIDVLNIQKYTEQIKKYETED